MNGTFEDKLLGELKQVVVERAAEPAPRRHRRPRLALAAGIAAVLIAGTAVALPVLTAQRASPAWAVTQQADGWVRVTITDYSDAEGLERRLEDVGVPADVHYLLDYRCPPNRSKGISSWDHLRTERVGPDETRFLVDPAAFEPGQTLVVLMLTNSYDGQRYPTFVIGVATGPIEPCTPLPGSQKPR